jgi:hypothetical protein
MAQRHEGVYPGWPRLMGRDMAARYCDMSATTLETYCDVEPVPVGGRRLFRRDDLDRWIDRLAAGEETSADDPFERRLES